MVFVRFVTIGEKVESVHTHNVCIYIIMFFLLRYVYANNAKNAFCRFRLRDTVPGAVVFFQYSFPKLTQPPLKVLHGEPVIGASFGHSVLAVDLDSDG